MHVRLLLFSLLLATATALPAQEQDLSKVEIKSTALGGGLYVLEGSGGNIAALTGTDGVLLVDDEFGVLADKIRAALKGLGADKPMRFIVNTHYHSDHTDGNLAFARAGATIISHDNLRTRLATGGTAGNGASISREVKPVDAGALPEITYQSELTVHLDGEQVRVHHYANAHTDGDSVVFFRVAKAVHMGDIFVRYGFPFIDIDGGGNVRGMIAACEDVIRTVPADTKIIPGHGELASLEDLRTYTKMLEDTSALVAQGRAAGKSLEQMKQEKLLAAWSARYAPPKAFVDTDVFIESLYNSLAAPRLRHGPAPRPQ
jgi:glyoxylase-like metal-dependent hydrolase (beta-lactamase superfamily II)